MREIRPKMVHGNRISKLGHKHNLKHGHTRNENGKSIVSPEYAAWANMLQRCYNENITDYKDYGGRGIKVASHWLEFINFITDMGLKPSSKHSLDRINVDGHYEPSNCRWATRKEQLANRRKFAAITNYTDTELIAELERRGYQVAKKQSN